MGFDDNTQQTPDNQEDIPTQVVEQVIPAEPEIAVFQPVQVFTGKYRPIFNGQFDEFVPIFRTEQRKVVLRPAQPEQVIRQEIPGVQFPEKNASVVSRLDGNFDVQWANARGFFTLDARVGAEYYWNRDVDPLEYNGSLSASYVRRLSPKVQTSAVLSLNYLSQPDFTQVNVVNTPGGSGNYLVGNAKLDLSYRWSARFSTVTSLTANTTMYEGARETGNFWDAGFGNEFRYIQSRKTTWVVEGRYSHLQYLEGAQTVIKTISLLLGADWTFSRRFRSTVRLGESVRTFETGGNQSTPYGEVALTYQPNRRDQFTLVGRYGFEQTLAATDETIVSRISMGYTRTFSPRLVGSINGNYVKNTSETAGGTFRSTNDVYDGSLILNYTFNRHFSMNARYSYTLSKTSSGFSDYDRSRFFLTGTYEF